VSTWATQCASEWKERQTRRRTCSGVRSFPIPARSAWSSSSNPAAQCSSTCSIQPCDDHRSPSKYVTFVRKDSSSSANESTSKDHPSRQNTHRVVHIVHEARRIQVENIVHARHPLLRVRRHLLSEFPTNCRWHQEFARNSNCTRPASPTACHVSQWMSQLPLWHRWKCPNRQNCSSPSGLKSCLEASLWSIPDCIFLKFPQSVDTVYIIRATDARPRA